ncbi:MAG: MBOAT family O-acyltransferase [Sarcina sp.]
MVFSSIVFIFRFFIIAMPIYYLTPRKYKNFLILILSLFFYSFGEPKYFFVMISSIIVDFFVGIYIEKYRKNKLKAKILLLASISFNLGILIFFKYSNFFIENINWIFKSDISILNLSLPLGISFYTFQTMTYSIDIYRKKIKAQKNIINFGAYVALFPQLIAGPIVKYSQIEADLTDRNIDYRKIYIGIKFFIIGLARKVLIANNIGVLWNEIQNLNSDRVTTGIIIIGAIAVTIQIYFDFSGYSLMARGLGYMLGFTFPKNFNYPFISKSVSEFWRRWHITLGSFFKEYVYIPLGGNKKNIFLNLLIVWVLTGFWHGASYNFILWGLYFFVFIAIEKMFLIKYLNKSRILAHIYLLIVVIISFLIFSANDKGSLAFYFSKLLEGSFSSLELYYIRNYIFILIVAIIFSIPKTKKIFDYIFKKYEILENVVLIGLFIISISYLVDASYNPFMYFRF